MQNVPTAAPVPARLQHIFDVVQKAHGDSIAKDPDAWRGKFRKMSASAFPFYRGSAPLFFHDVAKENDPFLDEQTSRVWIQGDLHASNFGTYMSSAGNLVFDVNDFDEAYIAPFTWDVKRLIASVYLLGYEKVMSDSFIEQGMRAVAENYMAQVNSFVTQPDTRNFAWTLKTASGKVLEILQSARLNTRVGMLNQWTEVVNADRKFKLNQTAAAISAGERETAMAAFKKYLKTIPRRKKFAHGDYDVKDVIMVRGMGIGSAGLSSYNFLLEGPTEALENDIIIFMKPGQKAAPSWSINDASLDAQFEHDGHRTVVSQRALQAHSDPWLGHTEIGGLGYMVQEASAYTTDIDWGGINKPAEILDTLGSLGKAVAKIHCISDEDSDQAAVPFSAEQAIHRAIVGREAQFVEHLVEFGFRYGRQAREDHEMFFDAFRNGLVPGV